MDENSRHFASFSIQFTGLVIIWNACELIARQILHLMLGESQTAMAVAADMQNRSLTYALRAGAREEKFKELREHIDHFVKGYDTILTHRNFYVHSLAVIDGNKAQILSLSSKGRLKYHYDTVTSKDLNAVMNHANRLAGYGAAIQKELGATGDGLEKLAAAYEASLEKPEWPASLERLPHYIQAP